MEKDNENNITGPEKVLTDLVNETRFPVTDKEQELADQIQAIKEKGRTVEIPSELI